MDEGLKLIDRSLAGDRTAFKELVEQYQDYVFTITQRVLNNREEAEEAAQDVFIKVYRSMRSFQRKSKFTTWLYTIAYRTALDRARRHHVPLTAIDEEGSRFQLAEQSNSLNPEQELHRQDLNRQLKMAIGRLKPSDSALITLFYLHEKSIKEIAQVMGLTVTNVKTKLHRLRESLKKELSHQLASEIQDLI